MSPISTYDVKDCYGPLVLRVLRCYVGFVVETSLHSLTTPNVMKLFASKFYQTLLFNVATIAAVVVGVSQFAIRAYKENNGNEKVRKMMQTLLHFVDAIVEQGLVMFADPVTVPVQQQSTKRVKVA